ncbi:uncharacterized protein DUF4956 [Paenibacillus cellulosilyticus]|uniref:Uncharacterized protein DUF4956 n=1 Tax=Paenibacillus cellulosilyticus TaxID=375489 RepID=A0A2V2YR04_9BACL|nr:DUF4956 domain-containing protein [Paenibacillus cellulosilyticus]PWV92474.1 uncharacterized protein DUF4956 [Paenibacillus cellulosilyticus]QKS47047.1 DUF4956 domain-containing protein [Paenibacillus cellulosilyticus]
MLDSLFSTTASVTELSLSDALITLFLSFALGAIISLTYMKTQATYTQSFALTMIVLPTIVAIIILLIGSNIARAFSLAGAFSIIRFRSAPGDSKDISFVLFTMAAGLACGVGAYGYAVLFTIVLCLLMFLLKAIKFGAKTSTHKLLKVTIPENLNYERTFDEIFNIFNVKYELKKVRTTELGSLYELVYAVTFDDNIDQKELLDAIRVRNGNLDISLTMAPTVVEG